MDWLIGNVWQCPKKGIKKEVLSLRFERVEKPTEVSKCRVKITDVSKENDFSSFYLTQKDEFTLEMGTAILPIDCYIEILVQNMLLGETSLCQIRPRIGQSLIFEMTLTDITSSKYLFQLTCQEMFELAQRYRTNGVAMFKKYPKFAHDYFSRGAKCLLSFRPFNVLKKSTNGVDGSDMETLLQTLQTNISACLLQEKRYDDVIYQTEFVENLSPHDAKKAEKAIYRRALAFYNVKAYDKAMATIEMVEGLQDKKEFLSLYNRTREMWKRDEDKYKTIVQRMFN